MKSQVGRKETTKVPSSTEVVQVAKGKQRCEENKLNLAVAWKWISLEGKSGSRAHLTDWRLCGHLEQQLHQSRSHTRDAQDQGGGHVQPVPVRQLGWEGVRCPCHLCLLARPWVGSQSGAWHQPTLLTMLAMKHPGRDDAHIFQIINIKHSGKYCFSWASRCNEASIGVFCESGKYKAAGPSFIPKAICLSLFVCLKNNVIRKMVGG